MVFILGIGETVIGSLLTFAAGWLGFDKLKEKLRGAKQKVSGAAQELQEFSAELREEGFIFYAEIIDHLVIRDFLGAIAAYRRLRKMFRKDKARHDHFDGIFLKWIPGILDDKIRRIPFVEAVNEWKRKNPVEAAKLETMPTPPVQFVPIASQPEALVSAPPVEPMVRLDELAAVLAEKVSEKLPAVQPAPPAVTIPATVGK